MHLLKILLLTILTPILLLGNTATPNGFAAGKKRALLIAIGDYPENGGWQKINSVNDLVVVLRTFYLLVSIDLQVDLTFCHKSSRFLDVCFESNPQ